MNVVRFPVVPKERPQGEPVAEPHSVMASALAHMEQLVGIYREVGARPNPVTILMMIASILEEPELRKAANLAAKNLAAGFDASPPSSQDEPAAIAGRVYPTCDTNHAEVGQARLPVDDPHDNTEAEKAG